MAHSDTPIDPAITQAVIMYNQVAVVGSRVKHWAQRYTEFATATVEGFYEEASGKGKVRVKPDKPNDTFGNTWDWDRTELAPDIQD